MDLSIIFCWTIIMMDDSIHQIGWWSDEKGRERRIKPLAKVIMFNNVLNY